MKPFCFVHAADLHLDSPFTGLRARAPEHVVRSLHEATFDAYDNIVELCISERVDALLVAGDVYDGADRSLRAQHRFVQGLTRLHRAGIRSFVCHGNHDPLDGWEARLEYPPSCHRFGAEFEAVPVFEEDPGRAAVHGVSYPKRHVRTNLARRLGRVDSDAFNIGLLHANVGDNPDHGAYAPCSLSDLAESGVDYWALGHVHTRRVLSRTDPTVVYPGNPQGTRPTERGARGVYLVRVGSGGRTGLEFRPVDTVRWERLEVDVSGMETEQELIDRLHRRTESSLKRGKGLSLVLRFALTGRGTLHGSLRRPDFLDALVEGLNEDWASRSPFAWCERIRDETAAPFDRRDLLLGSDFVADLLRLCDRAKSEPELLARLRGDLDELYRHRKFGRYLRDSVPDDQDLAVLIDEAESIALDLLLEGGS